MSRSGLTISGIIPGSPAEQHGIQKGDLLLRINGQKIHDCIDYRFHECEESVHLEFLHKKEFRQVTLSKEIDEDLGLQLEDPLYRTCRNHCLFCFIRQMPEGLRKTLYVRDDDYRLSFLHGNFITLTNLEESDFERILTQRLSPLYVSVHATDDAVRRKLLGNPDAPPILPTLRRLIDQGIRLHTQLVLCPGLNDGEILGKTLSDLQALFPGVQSLAVVPVGTTRFREGAVPWQQITRAYAVDLLRAIQRVQQQCRARFSTPWVFPSDEIYLTARSAFPPLEFYGDLPQLENGVGMVSLLQERTGKAVRELPRGRPSRKITVATGVLAYPVVEPLFRKIAHQTGHHIRVVPIRNRFFGETVTVTGLLTGSDLIAAFAEEKNREPILLPPNMLHPEKKLFLDGLHPAEVENRLNRSIHFPGNSPQGLLKPFRDVKLFDLS